MSQERLSQSDFEDLCAWRDGELPDARAGDVRQHLRAEGLWREALRELEVLDRALGALPEPPVPINLSDRIVHSVRRKVRNGRVFRVLRIAVPLAAAAAVLVAAALWGDWSSSPQSPDVPPVVQKGGAEAHPERVAADDRLAREHLDFFRNMYVLENYETLEAIERIETASHGT